MSAWLRRLASAILPPVVAEPLRRALRWWSVSRFAPYDARHEYGGHALTVRIADPLARGWYDHDWDAPSELPFLGGHGWLAPGMRVFDAGAHQGVLAMMMARMVGESGDVVAIEANPHNVRQLRANIASNAPMALRAVHAAIADAEGVLWFEDRWNGAVSATPGIGIRVDALTLDALAERLGTPDVVLIDVEGYELHALRGASRLRASARVAWVVEAHVGAGLDQYGSVEDLRRLMPATHSLWVAPGEAGGFVPWTDESAAVTRDRFRLVALPPAR